jgi:hypothetical protein
MSATPRGFHAHPPNCDFRRIRHGACRFAALDREGAILRPMLAISAGLAVLRGGCNCRHRRDDRDRTVLGLIRGATLRVLSAAQLPHAELLCPSVLRAADGYLTANHARGTSVTYARASGDSFTSEPCVASLVGCVLFLPGQQRLLSLCHHLRRCLALRPDDATTTVGAAINPPAAVRVLFG